MAGTRRVSSDFMECYNEIAHLLFLNKILLLSLSYEMCRVYQRRANLGFLSLISAAWKTSEGQKWKIVEDTQMLLQRTVPYCARSEVFWGILHLRP